MSKRNVFVVGYAPAYAHMYVCNGWNVVAKMADADIVQFIGGADVNPELYGEKMHPLTSPSSNSDERDLLAYEQAQKLGLYCVGICRGGQFLNVMSGGKMYQHVDKHAGSSGHQLTDLGTGETLKVSSTHHQMMLPGPDAKLIGVADEGTYREVVDEQGHPITLFRRAEEEDDIEVLYYEKTKCLCFQPHPELFSKDHECQVYFFSLLERFCTKTEEKDHIVSAC